MSHFVGEVWTTGKTHLNAALATIMQPATEANEAATNSEEVRNAASQYWNTWAPVKACRNWRIRIPANAAMIGLSCTNWLSPKSVCVSFVLHAEERDRAGDTQN